MGLASNDQKELGKGKKTDKKKEDSSKKKYEAEKKKPRAAIGKKKRKSSLLDDLLEAREALMEGVVSIRESWFELVNDKGAKSIRGVIGIGLILVGWPMARSFYQYSHMFAESASRPQIMFKAQLQTGEWIIVDDYREAYHWLRNHTEKDARVMAW